MQSTELNRKDIATMKRHMVVVMSGFVSEKQCQNNVSYGGVDIFVSFFFW